MRQGFAAAWITTAFLVFLGLATLPEAEAVVCTTPGSGSSGGGSSVGGSSSGDRCPDPQFSSCTGAWSGSAGSSCGAWVRSPQGATATSLSALALAALVFKTALVGMFTRLRPSRLLEQPTRARLHGIIEARPGVSYQELRTLTGIGKGTLEHHLGVLVRNGCVLRMKAAGRVSYILRGSAAADLGAALPALRSEQARRIAEALQDPTTTPALCRAVGLSGSAVHFHRRRLVEAGIVSNKGSMMRPLWHLTPLGQRALAT